MKRIMKLRNKKTGDILPLQMTINGKEYQSLSEFNEDFEDYSPKEPLIKDPKIRKVVRAWAELCNAENVAVTYGYDGKTVITYKAGASIQFPMFIEIKNADEFKVNEFSITELIGEEEKAWSH